MLNVNMLVQDNIRHPFIECESEDEIKIHIRKLDILNDFQIKYAYDTSTYLRNKFTQHHLQIKQNMSKYNTSEWVLLSVSTASTQTTI